MHTPVWARVGACHAATAKGEPRVNAPQDRLRCTCASGMAVLADKHRTAFRSVTGSEGCHHAEQGCKVQGGV